MTKAELDELIRKIKAGEFYEKEVYEAIMKFDDHRYLEARSVLEGLLYHPSMLVRSRALLTLTNPTWDKREYLEVALELLRSDPYSAVRSEAAKSIGLLCRRHGIISPLRVLLGIVKKEKDDILTRKGAYYGLLSYKDHPQREEFVLGGDRLFDEDPEKYIDWKFVLELEQELDIRDSSDPNYEERLRQLIEAAIQHKIPADDVPRLRESLKLLREGKITDKVNLAFTFIEFAMSRLREALPYVEAYIDHHEPNVRTTALETAIRLTPEEQRHRYWNTVLDRIHNDANMESRGAAASLLPLFSPPKSRREILKVLLEVLKSDGVTEVKWSAYDALGHMLGIPHDKLGLPGEWDENQIDWELIRERGGADVEGLL